MHCRRRATYLILVALCGTTLLPTAATAQEADDSLLRMGVVRFEGSDWREALAHRVGEGDTYWWTSNAEYARDGAEPSAFGQAWVWGVGAVSAHGCLFSETEGGPALAWTFFQAWDPERQALFSYQSAASGTFGVGWETPVPLGHTSEMVQTFVARDGTRSRLRHETDYVAADTMVTRSYDWDDASGEWTPRRTYTWTRRDGDPQKLCPGLARGDV
ncbi:MAG: hypothetical protein ACODAB_08845 [Gemmatimonadota bacterium]